jgi:hypothetical protein
MRMGKPGLSWTWRRLGGPGQSTACAEGKAFRVAAAVLGGLVG